MDERAQPAEFWGRGGQRWPRLPFDALSALLTLAIVYLTAHTVGGPQGLAKFIDLQRTERDLTIRRDLLDADRARLIAQVSRLRADQLDRDYLDERARALADLSRAEELIVVEPRP